MIKWHIFLSTLALILMILAGGQAIALALQNYLLRHLQHEQSASFLKYLPPMETMEKWLFRLIIAGFIVLSAVLISSFIFFHPVLAPEFRQKFILTLITWSVFAWLLTGHFYWGWRGKRAIRWTLAGVILLLIIYCGTGLLLNGTFS